MKILLWALVYKERILYTGASKQNIKDYLEKINLSNFQIVKLEGKIK